MTFLEKNNEIKWFKLPDLVVWRYCGRILHGGKDQSHLFNLFDKCKTKWMIYWQQIRHWVYSWFNTEKNQEWPGMNGLGYTWEVHRGAQESTCQTERQGEPDVEDGRWFAEISGKPFVYLYGAVHRVATHSHHDQLRYSGLLITQKIASSTHWNPLGHTGIPCKGSPGTPSHHDQLKSATSPVLIKLQKTFWYRWNRAEKIYWLMLPIKASFAEVNFHWSKSHNCQIAKHTIAVCVQHWFCCFYCGL